MLWGLRTTTVYLAEPGDAEISGLVGNQDLSTQDGFRIGIVFLSTALELLLEDSLREQLWRHVKTADLTDYLLRTIRGRDSRLRLCAAPYGMNSRGVMVTMGKVAFLDIWDKLAAARNEIAHGKYVMGNKITQNEFSQVQQDCLSVFAALQNLSSTGKPHIPTA